MQALWKIVNPKAKYYFSKKLSVPFPKLLWLGLVIHSIFLTFGARSYDEHNDNITNLDEKASKNSQNFYSWKIAFVLRNKTREKLVDKASW